MSDFKVVGEIKKAYKEDDKYLVSGVASGTQVDREFERMALSAIVAFKRAIDEGILTYEGEWSYIPLISGHDQEWDRRLGWVIEAEITKESDLVITAELDPTSPDAMSLFSKLSTPKKVGKPLRLGFSVGGRVLSAGQEWDEELQRFIYVYHDVALREMTVTGFPAYAPSYLTAISKSVNWHLVEGQAHVVLAEKDETQEKSAQVGQEVSNMEDITKNEEQVAESTDNVEKQVEDTDASQQTVEDTNEEVNKDLETDPLSLFRDQVNTLMKSVSDLVEEVTAIREQLGSMESDAEEATKSSEQVPTDVPAVVEKSEGNSVGAADLSISNVTEVIKAAISEMVEPLVQRLGALESQPVDKSFAVTSVNQDEDPVTKFIKESEGKRGEAVIAAALKNAIRS